jgi:ABC-type branched-subunit amino acid transport system ATPase component
MSDTLLEAAGLSAGYEDVPVLEDVSIQVPRGAVVSIIGPNGAGKSTLLRAIYGMATLSRGRVVFEEQDITGWKPHRLTARGLNYVPQLDNVFPSLSVLENLQLGGPATRLDPVLESFPALPALLHRPAGSLSGGQRQALALARALMSEPRLLLLDEPSAGLAPAAMTAIYGNLKRLGDEGLTILMVEQNARQALAMSDYAYVLEAGRNRHEGPAGRLLHDPRVVELYLGAESRDTGTTDGRFASEC